MNQGEYARMQRIQGTMHSSAAGAIALLCLLWAAPLYLVSPVPAVGGEMQVEPQALHQEGGEEGGDASAGPSALRQEGGEMPASRRVGLELTLEQDILQEGQDTELQLRATQLLADETLEVSITLDSLFNTCFPGAEVRFTPPDSPVELTARDAVRKVRVIACQDFTPEPRKTVQISLQPDLQPLRSGVTTPTSRVLFVIIPRNGYILELTRESSSGSIEQGGTVEYELRLHAPAPSTVEATVRAAPLPGRSGETVDETALIHPGATTARLSITFAQPGFYGIRVAEARFTRTEPGDQPGPDTLQVDEIQAVSAPPGAEPPPEPPSLGPPFPGTPPPGTPFFPTQPPPPPRLVSFTVSPPRLDEAGEAVDRSQLIVSAADLVQGSPLVVFLSSDHPEDVRFSTNRLVLSAASRTGRAELLLIPDREAEPREVVQLTARAAGAGMLTESLFIPRNGYSSAMSLEPQPALAGAPVLVKVSLNAPAPEEARFGVQVLRGPGRVEVLLEDFRIPVGMSSGSVSIRLAAGEYEVVLVYARFVEQAGPGDQLNLLELPPPMAEVMPPPMEEMLPLSRSRSLRVNRRSIQGDAALQTPSLETGRTMSLVSGQTAILAEGQTATLAVSTPQLLEGETLAVRITVDRPGNECADGADVFFTPGRMLTLKAPDTDLEVKVRACRDFLPEPRETVELTLQFELQPGGHGVSVPPNQFWHLVIPRNDYVLELHRQSPFGPIGQGESVEYELGLNAPAPSTVETTVRMAPLPGSTGEAVVKEVLILPGATTADFSITFAQSGLYGVGITDSRFTHTEPGDQSGPGFLRVSAVQEVSAAPDGSPPPAPSEPPRLVSFTVSPSRLDEVGEAVDRSQLSVSAVNLVAGSPLVVFLSSDHPEDVEFSTNRLVLSAASRTGRAELLLIPDREAEPREVVQLTARTADAGMLTENVFIPRNGYSSRMSLEQPLLRAGAPARVQVSLNGPAPARARFGVQVLREPGAVAVSLQDIYIPVGMSTSSAGILLPAGRYQLVLAYARFTQQSGPGDQVELRTQPPPRAQLQVEPRRIELRAELETQTLAEGATAPLRVSASGLDGLTGFRLRIDSDSAADLQFSPDTVQLAATARTMTVSVRALRDNRPELREAWSIRVDHADPLAADVEVQAAQLMVSIPRNGYRVQSLGIISRGIVGYPVQIEALLNAPAPVGVELQAQVNCVPGTGCSAVTQDFDIPVDEDTGRFELTLQEPGSWQLRLLRAEFSGPSEPGDQTGLLADAPPAPLQFQLGPRPISLQAELDRTGLREGETAELEIRARGLLGEDILRLAIADNPAGELRFSTRRVTLHAAAPTMTVTVAVPPNLAAPARTEVMITVRTRGTPSPRLELVPGAVQFALEVLRNRVPPTLPAPGLRGTAPGAYVLQLSWPRARDRVFPGDVPAPLTLARAYTLLYREALGPGCPAFSPGSYRLTATVMPGAGSGFMATLEPVRANTRYCFVLQITDDGGNITRTPVLELQTPEYDPGADNGGIDALPDDLEAVCGTRCTAVTEPAADHDGDGLNNVLEAYLQTADDTDAYHSGDGDDIPDIVELYYAARHEDALGNAMLTTISCDAGAWLSRLSSCAEYRDALEDMLLHIVMNAGGVGVYRGGASGLVDDTPGGANRVDEHTRLGAGTHWLSSPDTGRVVRLQLKPLLSSRASGAVIVPAGEVAEARTVTYSVSVLLQGPLPLGGSRTVAGSICRRPASPDFSLRTGLPVQTCPDGFASFSLSTDAPLHDLAPLSWQVTEEDRDKQLQLELRVSAGTDRVSMHSFATGNTLPALEAVLLFPASSSPAAGVRQMLVAYLVDSWDQRVGSADNGEPWRLQTEPPEAIDDIRLIDIEGVNTAGATRRQTRTVTASAGQIVLPARSLDGFSDSLVRLDFYSEELTNPCGVCSTSQAAFLGQVSFLVGTEDRDGNLRPDLEETGGAAPASATGEKGLPYSPAGAPEREYYLRATLGLRLGVIAALEELGLPPSQLQLQIPDELQPIDEVVLDFETFCTEDPDCLQAGEPTRLVFELRSRIPAAARYYKRRAGTGHWCQLVAQYDSTPPLPASDACTEPHREGIMDGLAFAAPDSDSGECPAPGAAAYDIADSPGAQRLGPWLDIPLANDRCVQLTITDNGPNDAKLLSGVIADPGFLAVGAPANPALPPVSSPPPAPAPTPAPAPAPAPVTSGGGGGGGGGSADWPLLLLLGAVLWFCRRRRSLFPL